MGAYPGVGACLGHYGIHDNIPVFSPSKIQGMTGGHTCSLGVEPMTTLKHIDYHYSHIKGNSVLKACWREGGRAREREGEGGGGPTCLRYMYTGRMLNTCTIVQCV